MDAYLNALRTKRAEVQTAINAEYSRPYPDALVLAELKKRKLRLREAIERIEGKPISWGRPAQRPHAVASRAP